VTRHQVHVWPALRMLGSLVLRDWLAITVGHHILAWRPLTARELEHELEHVRQWARHGWPFPIAYVLASLRARRAGKRWYQDNRFEVEARAAADRAGSGPIPT
jgi:hypothetical protein